MSLNLPGFRLQLRNPSVAKHFIGIATGYIFPSINHTLGWVPKTSMAPMVIEDIFYLGDTRSADDLAVFTGMPPERCVWDVG